MAITRDSCGLSVNCMTLRSLPSDSKWRNHSDTERSSPHQRLQVGLLHAHPGRAHTDRFGVSGSDLGIVWGRECEGVQPILQRGDLEGIVKQCPAGKRCERDQRDRWSDHAATPLGQTGAEVRSAMRRRAERARMLSATSAADGRRGRQPIDRNVGLGPSAGGRCRERAGAPRPPGASR